MAYAKLSDLLAALDDAVTKADDLRTASASAKKAADDAAAAYDSAASYVVQLQNELQERLGLYSDTARVRQSS